MLNNFMPQIINKGFSFLYARNCRKKRVAPGSILFPVIWITNRCNLRCKICDQWKTDPSLISQELEARDWLSFVDSAKRLNSAVIVITGGEPLLRPDIFDILNYIHKNGLASHLITNGTLLSDDTINKLKISGVDSISVSLDSYIPEIHNNIRGCDCFGKVVKGIKTLRRSIPEANIGINCVITKQNFIDIYKMINFAENLGVDQIKFDPIHTNLMHRKKDLSSFEGFLFADEDLPKLSYEIDKLIHTVSKTKLLTNSPIFLKGMFNRHKGKKQRFPCYAGYISCAIDALGYVSVCDNFDGLESIRDKSLEDIWKSRSFQYLREKVHNCKSSCWDTTHGELNIRCSLSGAIGCFGQTLKEISFYFGRGKNRKEDG